MIAANSASSSSYDVRISALIEESMERMSRHTSMPEPSGSRPSRMATCGRSAGMRRVASWAEPDSPTTTMSPSLSSSSLMPAAYELVVVEQVDPDGRRGGIVRGRGPGIVGHLPKVVPFRRCRSGAHAHQCPHRSGPRSLCPRRGGPHAGVQPSTTSRRSPRDHHPGSHRTVTARRVRPAHPAPHRRARHPGTERAQHPALALAGGLPLPRAVRRPVPHAVGERPGRAATW